MPPRSWGPDTVNRILCRPLLPLGSQRQGWWGGSPPPQGLGQSSRQPWPGLEPLGHSPSLSLGNLLPTHQAASLRLGELEGPRKNASTCLLPHSPPNDHHSANSWLISLSNGCSLTSWWLLGTSTMASTSHEKVGLCYLGLHGCFLQFGI